MDIIFATQPEDGALPLPTVNEPAPAPAPKPEEKKAPDVPDPVIVDGGSR
jgi:hypothetical protein